MKSCKTMILTVIIAGMLCTGCGAVSNIKDYSQAVSDAGVNSDSMEDTEKDNVNKDTVSGDDGKSNKSSDTQKMEEKRCYYENNDNSYDVTYDDDGNGYLVQYGLNLKKVVRKVKIQNIDEVVWVTDEWVYYTEDNDNNDSLWRMPVKKSEKGDRLEVSGKEKLFSMEYISVDVYITDSYIIFSGGEKENKNSSLYKYGIKDKKYSKLLNMDLDYCDMMYGEGFPFMIDGMLFVYDDYKIYQLNPDTGDTKKIYECSEKCNELDIYKSRVSGGCLYFIDNGNNFYKYNVGDEKAKCLISSDSFGEVMEKLNLWGEKSKRISISINDCYIYNGIVYFAVYADWKERNSKIFGKKVWVDYDCEEVLLSVPLDDIMNLQCVDVVKKYIDTNIRWDTYEEGQRYHAVKDIEMDFIDGKMVLNTRCKNGDGKFAVYNLDTAKVREISQEEWTEIWD